MTMGSNKPSFHLLGGTRITAEHLARMFKALTTKDVTTAAIEDARVALDEAYRALEGGRHSKTEMEEKETEHEQKG
jgi:hypothetical protein